MLSSPAVEATGHPNDRDIVRQVGIVLIVIGAIQLVYHLYKAPPGQIRFEILALVMGLVVYAGNFRAVSAVRWLAWFGIIPLVYQLLMPFIVAPAELSLLQLRLYPGQLAPYYLSVLFNLALACLVARQLGRPAVLAARKSAGRKLRDMRIPLVLGLVLTVAAAAFQVKALNGEDARRAEAVAAAQLGPGYKYYTNQIWFSVSPGKSAVHATVQAWNDKEVRAVPVAWAK